MSIQINGSLLKASVLLFTSLFIFNVQAGVVDSTLALTTTNPDISSIVYTAEYTGNSTDGTFTSLGQASQLTTAALTSETIDSGTFELNASIQQSAGTADGLLSIGGTITALGFSSGTLITATLLQIGGPNTALNFLFNVTGGDAAALYGGVGATIGVIMNFMDPTGYNGSFNAAFESDKFTSSDTFVVEVATPNSVSIFLIGFIVLGLRKKLRG